jgi:hypothetical protein
MGPLTRESLRFAGVEQQASYDAGVVRLADQVPIAVVGDGLITALVDLTAEVAASDASLVARTVDP